jgi:hypothetical protein
LEYCYSTAERLSLSCRIFVRAPYGIKSIKPGTIEMALCNDLQLASPSSTAGARFALAVDVYKVDQESGSRLFDFQRGRFYGVDATGACILNQMLQRPFEHAVTNVAAHYGVPQQRVHHDALALVTSLTHRRLLIDRRDRLQGAAELEGAARISTRHFAQHALRWFGKRILPGALRRLSMERRPRAALKKMRRLLRMAWASYRWLGWQESIRLWQRLPMPGTPDRSYPVDMIASIDTLVRNAATSVLLTPMACKERALVGWALLRIGYGLPAELVIGFQPHPFGLHAWVECEGRVLTDEAARCEPYQPIVRYA